MTQTPSKSAQGHPGRMTWDSWLTIRLVLLLLAVMATMVRFWPPLTLLLWLLAASGIVWVMLRRPGRDAVDWVARGLGVVVSGVIIAGVALNAVSIPLDSTTWALTFGVVGTVILVGSHLWDQRRVQESHRDATHGEGHLAGPLDLSHRSASEDMARFWRTKVVASPQTRWLLLTTVLLVGAVMIGVLTQPRQVAELELSLSSPAAASTNAQRVTVRVAANTDVENLILRVVPAVGPAELREQRFSVQEGQPVEREVALPPTGESRVELRSPGRPELTRVLTINR